MTIVPATINDFAGLDLTSPADSSGCINALNVDVATPGVVRTRDGSTAFGAALTTGTDWIGQIGAYPADVLVTEHALAKVYALSGTDGTLLITDTSSESPIGPFVSVGTPSATYAYAPNNTGTLKRYQPGTHLFSDVNPGYAFSALTLYPTENRLVGVTTEITAQSRVRFSDAGAPETFSTNNYVDLTPGDGEQVLALASWNGMVFAFKQSRIFIFYGTSIDATGNPVFNYRTVQTGGVRGPYQVACAPQGVFFLNPDGVWVTTGGPPRKISQQLDAWFGGDSILGFAGAAINATEMNTASLWWAHHRLFVALTGRQFVWDERTATWSYWTHPGACFAEIVTSGIRRYLAGPSTAGVVLKESPGSSTDNGAAITGTWQSGFSNFGTDANKRIRGAKAWGSGASTTFATAHDFGAVGTTDSLGWGSSTGIGRARRGTRGELLSFQLSGTAPWRCERIEVQLAGIRQDNPQAQATV